MNKPFCVYAHVINGEIVYVGSGSHARAFTTKNRTWDWKNATHGEIIDVVILSEHKERNEAYAAEANQIAALQPVANRNHANPTLSRKGLKIGRPPKHRAREGKRIYCRTLDVYCETLEQAAAYAGVSVATISRMLDSGLPVRTARGDYYFELAP